MTVSLSFTIVNTYAPPGVKPATATAVERKTPPVQDDEAGGCCSKRPASRQNRFADAMMSALRELGLGGTASPSATPAAASTSAAATPAASTASTASTTATAATPATSSTGAAAAPDASASVESAVQQFAHALFQALRQGGSSNKADDRGDERVEGHGHHRHHHHRRHGEGQAYGNMSQRLEALSQTVGAPAAAAAPAATGTATAVGSSLSLTLSVGDAAADTPAATTSTAPAATGSPATVIAAPVATAAKTPLLDAFTKLFNALKPPSTDTTATSTPATDMAEKLRLFLHTLAQALAPDTMGSVQRAQVGSMVNVTA